MIAIVDYGSGNIRAFANIFSRLGVPFRFVREGRELAGFQKIILPGVGAFDHTMERLEASGLRAALDAIVQADQAAVLGVCVGMQILGRRSEEGVRSGLGWLKGEVRKIPVKDSAVRLPHMGWNDVSVVADVPLLAGLRDRPRFYFLHSYYFHCDNRSEVIATTDYGESLPCVVGIGRIYGVQFHPEKSHAAGIQLLKNFSEL